MSEEPQQETPGDEVPQTAPSSGPDACPNCSGSGEVDGETCPACQGTGTVEEGVGGG
jgi:DnaJ-class molecular chaperone